MSLIKAIIFDMDGVLVDAKEWHFDALNDALQLFGFKISRFDHLRRYDGLPTRKKLEMLTEACGFPRGLHHFTNRMKQQFLLEIAARECVPNQQHLHTLESLREQGYATALASNSIRMTVDVLMEQTALGPMMDFTLSNEDVAAPKPNPDIYQLAMQRLGFEPHECLVVEDGEYGVRAAKEAGAHVLRVHSVHDVHLLAIQDRILEIETASRFKWAA